MQSEDLGLGHLTQSLGLYLWNERDISWALVLGKQHVGGIP